MSKSGDDPALKMGDRFAGAVVDESVADIRLLLIQQ